MISWNRDRCTSGRPNAALTRSAAAVASFSCCRYEARVRSDEQTERGRGVVHDPHARPQLADRSTPLLGCQRGPRLVQVLASNLLGHDPVMTLDRARPEDPRVSDLGRQRSDERDLRGHVDGRVRDPHGDAVTDPGRVRVPQRPTHPGEVTAVLGGHLSGEGPNEGRAGWVAILVEWVRLRHGLVRLCCYSATSASRVAA